MSSAGTSTPDLATVTTTLTAPGAPFEMEEQDVRGVTVRTWKNAPPTLREVLEVSRAHGDAEFLVYDSEPPGAVPGPFDRLTFAAHFDAAVGFARHLIEDIGI